MSFEVVDQGGSSKTRRARSEGGGPLDRTEELLTSLEVRVHAFALCKVAPDCRLLVAPTPAVLVHYILEGRGTLTCDGCAPVSFTAGNVVIAPPGRAKRIAVTEGPATDFAAEDCCSVLSDGLRTFEAGKLEGGVVAACGTLTATYAGGFGVFDGMSEPLVARADGTGPLRAALELMLAEARSPGFGTRTMMETCMKQCMLLLLRARLDALNAEEPHVFAFRDPRLLRAIGAVVAEPAARHTLGSLADTAGMSRSAFIRSFAEGFGQTPFEFVQKVRLRHAAHLLSSTLLPVKMIARSAGFLSRSHFSRSFTAAYGRDPTSWRADNDGLQQAAAG